MQILMLFISWQWEHYSQSYGDQNEQILVLPSKMTYISYISMLKTPWILEKETLKTVPHFYFYRSCTTEISGEVPCIPHIQPS